MFINNLPLSRIRLSATQSCTYWSKVVIESKSGNWENAVVLAKKANHELVKRGVIALSTLINSWILAVESTKKECLVEAIVLANFIMDEMTAVASGKIYQTLLYSEKSQNISRIYNGRIFEDGFFFLPALPDIDLIKKSSLSSYGSVADAVRDYSNELQLSIITCYKTYSIDNLKKICQTLQSIENRRLPSYIGLSFTLALAWLDGVSSGDLILSKNDILLLVKLNSTFKQIATGDIEFDSMLISALSYRIVNLKNPRSILLIEKLGLTELIEERGYSFLSLPDMNIFGAAWHECSSHWDIYCSNPTDQDHNKFESFLKLFHLKVNNNIPLSMILDDIDKLSLFIKGNLPENIKHDAMILISDSFAVMHEKYNSKDMPGIINAAKSFHIIVDKFIKDGSVQKIHSLPVFPVGEFFNEIGFEIGKIHESIKSGNVNSAKEYSKNVIISLFVVQNLENCTEFVQACEVIDKIINENKLDHNIILSDLDILKKSSESISKNEDNVVKKLLSELSFNVKNKIEVLIPPNKNIVTDKPEDLEIFEIFAMEAQEICVVIVEISNSALDNQIESNSIVKLATELRRHWHTVKGSSRMAGLIHFGDFAYGFEQGITQCIADGKVPLEWFKASLEGAEITLKCCKSVEDNGEFSFDEDDVKKIYPSFGNKNNIELISIKENLVEKNSDNNPPKIDIKSIEIPETPIQEKPLSVNIVKEQTIEINDAPIVSFELIQPQLLTKQNDDGILPKIDLSCVEVPEFALVSDNSVSTNDNENNSLEVDLSSIEIPELTLIQVKQLAVRDSELNQYDLNSIQDKPLITKVIEDKLPQIDLSSIEIPELILIQDKSFQIVDDDNGMSEIDLSNIEISELTLTNKESLELSITNENVNKLSNDDLSSIELPVSSFTNENSISINDNDNKTNEIDLLCIDISESKLSKMDQLISFEPSVTDDINKLVDFSLMQTKSLYVKTDNDELSSQLIPKNNEMHLRELKVHPIDIIENEKKLNIYENDVSDLKKETFDFTFDFIEHVDTQVLFEPENITNEIDKDIMDAFIKESLEMATLISNELVQVKNTRNINHELIRAAHSLAGMARIINNEDLELLSVSIENWAAHIYQNKVLFDMNCVDLAVNTSNEISILIQYFINGEKYVPNLRFAKELMLTNADSAGAESLKMYRDTIFEMDLSHSNTELDDNNIKNNDDLMRVISLDHEMVSDSNTQIKHVIKDIFASNDSIEAIDNEFNFDIDKTIKNDIDFEVFEPYMAEATESLEDMDALIGNFIPGVTPYTEINRLLHTLKGGARLCGLLQLGAMLHKMEDATTSFSLTKKQSSNLIKNIQKSLDKVRSILNEIIELNSKKDDTDIENVANVVKREEKILLRVDPLRLDAVSDLMGRIRITQDRVKRRTIAGFSIVDSMKSPMNRVSVLSNLIALEAESKMDSGITKNELTKEFDALEMDRFTALQEYTRRLLEAAEDINNIFKDTEHVFQDVNEAIVQQMELSNVLQGSLDNIGRSTIQSAEARMKAVVRQASSDCMKQCQLIIEGEVSIERAVMDKLIPAIEHMLRNSVAHGIENSDDRLKCGKSECGTILVSSKREGSYAIIKVQDDGAGINFEKVKASAISKKLLKNEDNVSEKNLIDMLFSAGFSTADVVSDTAGRGVGLDSVKESINRLGGRVTLESVQNSGTCFQINVPLVSGYVSGLMIQANGSPYIIPSAFIDGVELIKGDQLDLAIKNPGMDVVINNGEIHKIFEIGYLCGIDYHPRINAYHQVIEINGNSNKLIFGDHLEYINNFPLRQFKADASIGSGVIGYSLLSDGRIAVVINPDTLLAGITSINIQSLVDNKKRLKINSVLIVDDSITVRAVTSRFLKKNGIRVMTAENGAIALDRIAEEIPDVILMDIEMPVMDGFETITILKNNENWKHIPVAIISSRNAEKHRNYATSIGASAFFGKPYQDTDLLKWIKSEIELITKNSILF